MFLPLLRIRLKGCVPGESQCGESPRHRPVPSPLAKVSTIIALDPGLTEQTRLKHLRSFDVLDSSHEKVFDELTATVARLNHADVAAIVLVDANRLWIKAAEGLEKTEFARPGSFCDLVVNTRTTLAVSDAHADPRFCDCLMVTGSPWVRSYLGTPLISDIGSTLGTLCLLDTRPRCWSEEDHEVLELLARQVVAQLEIRKAKLAMRALREDYRHLAEERHSQMQQAQRRWCVALREGLAQELAGMSYLVQATRSNCRDERTAVDLGDVQQLMTGTLKHCLQIAQGLSELDEVELREELSRLVAVTQAETGISCNLHWNVALQIKSRLVSHGLLEIAREAIRNAVRHARCHQIQVSCAEGDGFIVLEISDDGCGIAVDRPLIEGVGITFMRCRAQNLGARLQVLPGTTQGLRVRCLAPNKIARTAAMEPPR